MSDRDSDAEFEQMLAEAEEANKVAAAEVEEEDAGGESNPEEESAGSGDTPPVGQTPNQIPVRRKAKTKIGNKSKKKKKTKTTSKFPSGDGEDGYEVCSDTDSGTEHCDGEILYTCRLAVGKYCTFVGMQGGNTVHL
jgi:chromodomain-helicase-DNA-binding protein 4